MRFLARLAYYLATIMIVAFVASALSAHAASPSGNDWYQILASPFTGGDNTGDGGTGLTGDLNYYYVGQSFTGTMQINVGTPAGSNAANIWIDYPTTTVSSSNLTTGSFFPNWSGQVVSTTIGRIYSTGFRTSGYATGLGSFGTVTFTMLKPSEAAYGTGAPSLLDINIGTVGATTESNISNDGTDLLDDAEDFRMHIWADTKKPYALNPSPANTASAVAIDSNYSFDLRDSKNGEGDNSGVGTGVNTSEPPGAITSDDGGGPSSVTAYDSFSCSGTWGTNLCSVTVDPPSPSGIPGDTRNWKYATTYTLTISGFQDLASSNQNQLGDANGPNTMDTKAYTFTTEADTVPPQVTAVTPARSSSGNSPSTNLTIDVQDRKTYPSGPSGVGLDSTTCRFDVSSPSFALTTYQQGSSGVTATAIDYGERFVINPATDFAQNETVTVTAHGCADSVGNVMTPDTWTFSTADSDAPYVTGESPSNDQTASTTQNAVFHVKDDGSGVDLANTVIFFNGTYYTNGGGAGQVTVNGTRITFASSLNFNGGNYVGDTTSRSGTINDETFTIDPQADYSPGEAVPVIIYSRDLSGNLMERVVYAFVAEGVSSSCPSGSSFCGAGTTWNGSQCVASGGGGGSCSASGGGTSAIPLSINEPTVSVTQLDEHSVLVTWATNLPAGSLLRYGTQPSKDGAPPRYGYDLATVEQNTTSTFHSVVLDGLSPGVLYYFRPVSRWYGEYAAGQERVFATRSPSQIVGEGNVTAGTPPVGSVQTTSSSAPILCPAPAAPSVITKTVTSTITQTVTQIVNVPGEAKTVTSTSVQWLERVREVVPAEVGYALLALAALLTLATLLLLRIGDPRHQGLVLAGVILLLASAAAGAILLHRDGGPALFPVSTGSGAAIDVRGTVMSPTTMSGVADVDVSVGDTSIKTSVSGRFAFPNAHAGDVMRLAAPSLARSVDWKLSGSNPALVIPFDPSLFNAMNTVLEAEAEGQSPSILFVAGDEYAPSIVISDVRFTNAGAELDVWKGSRMHTYVFVKEKGAWVPVK
ncbi:MAG TPA: fibronectin type III domain-containing protein [Verrucomicrobiae bacterium]|nr:fibronectin type III domain-containing protein [Verrucomicrobiae bacterium]